MQSVHKTFEVLETVATASGGMSLDALCKVIPYPKTTVHRICKCLCQCGYLRQADSGKYCLTTKMITLGYSVIHHDTFVAEAAPYMAALAEHTGFTVNLQRRDFDKVILLKKEEPKNSLFHTNAHAGLASSLLHSACGKVVLSYFSHDEQQKYWQSHCHDLASFRHFGQAEIQTEHDFYRELALIKQQGFAVDGEGNESGITCIAVPLETEQSANYAISVSGLTPEIHRFGQVQLLERLREVVRALGGKIR
ncbi:HTH-type transcriptional regulator YiaJ [Vibrio ruber DSM 16370]|uniref:HTH-type transcriptional regulator YiaJ n=1 Tax=Vibrio ruber (strain DSM 16370 / JCM 11486 / BCRC 17186 / CECT 7878 / LMG 23124 / VR1) TaxID=1123498 RepID=A0A1R4LC17_VIBR1|nr:IclR family transcriptional regulator [Vibrio ruber]SJN54068.1 HTH-type transcriptional regulator YiaJ [Vibrio ruber DSM 16370]